MNEGNPTAAGSEEFSLAVHKLWQRAVQFASQRHLGQMRKDGKTPYMAHPMRVALTVRHVFGVDDPVALAAALLHDVIEDTPTDFDSILLHFGPEVAQAVAALTKDPRLAEPEREAAYDKQLAGAAWQARLVKLADVFDNYCDSHNDEMRAKAKKSAIRAIGLASDDPRLQPAAAIVKQLIAKSF